MVMFALPTFAQNYTMRLAHIFSDDGYETWDYIYSDPSNTDLLCINEIDFTTNTECIDSIFYDERGNIVKLATWQNVPEKGGWIYACYVEYEYDENNLKISRTNYNDFGYGFELGGVYRYYYEDGKMTSWELEFFDMPDYQKAMIEYDENGYKLSETMLNYDMSTYQHEFQFLTEYEYDADYNLIRENEFKPEAGSWVLNTSRINEFDEYGNCIKADQVTAAGTVQERKIFEYDTEVSADKVFYYPNPEADYPQLPEAKVNLLKSFEFHAQNDANELAYVTTYFLDYAVVGNNNEDDTTSVQEVAFASSVYPNPAQDYVMVESSEADYVEVVDVYGRVMFSSEMSESVRVDMSEFASGIYFVKLQANGATSVQKIMKK